MGDVVVVLGSQPPVYARQMQGTMAAFGEANDFVGLGVPFVETDDASEFFCLGGIVALKGDDDRLRTGRSG